MEKFADVDDYLGRSELWPTEIRELRRVLLACDVTEEIKWGKPCYGHKGRNIAIVQEMKDFLALMFFKGALLEDPDGVLEAQGANSRSARRIRFTSVADVQRLADTVQRCVHEAIAVEDAGLEVAPTELVLVEELRRRLDQEPGLRTAFEALTPGRQREYNLYVSGAKQASTREARIERHVDKIRAGKGLRDR